VALILRLVTGDMLILTGRTGITLVVITAIGVIDTGGD